MSDDVPQNGTLAHLIRLAEATQDHVKTLAEQQRDIRTSLGGMRDDSRQLRSDVGEVRGEVREVRGEVRDVREDLADVAKRLAEVEASAGRPPAAQPPTTTDTADTATDADILSGRFPWQRVAWDRKLLIFATSVATVSAFITAIFGKGGTP